MKDFGKALLAGCSLAVALGMTTGCKSKQDAAVETAKQQAAATGQAQQVVSVDKSGNTTTTTVQPPVAGQTQQAVTTTVTPGAAPIAAQAASRTPAVAVAGGAPIIRPVDVIVPAGTSLAIRINQHISVKSTPAGARFDGELADSYTDANGRVILPKGSLVGGIVDASHKRGHFKGASILELRLTSLTLNGTQYPLETRDLTRTKKGKGKRSAAFIGGGTGLGMLIGGVATGGVGLAVGGLAGAGAGTAIGGLTGNRDIDIPAESIVRFKLADELTLQP